MRYCVLLLLLACSDPSSGTIGQGCDPETSTATRGPDGRWFVSLAITREWDSHVACQRVDCQGNTPDHRTRDQALAECRTMADNTWDPTET